MHRVDDQSSAIEGGALEAELQVSPSECSLDADAIGY